MEKSWATPSRGSILCSSTCRTFAQAMWLNNGAAQQTVCAALLSFDETSAFSQLHIGMGRAFECDAAVTGLLMP